MAGGLYARPSKRASGRNVRLCAGLDRRKDRLMASQPPPDTDFPDNAPQEMPPGNAPDEAPQQEPPGFDPPSPDYDQPDTAPNELPPPPD
jgi:hypothetical protein